MTQKTTDETTVQLQSMQQALSDGVAQLHDMMAALKEVVTLFEEGALTGPNGDRWRDQVRDKVLPFVDDTHTAMRDLAQQVESVTTPDA